MHFTLTGLESTILHFQVKHFTLPLCQGTNEGWHKKSFGQKSLQSHFSMRIFVNKSIPGWQTLFIMHIFEWSIHAYSSPTTYEGLESVRIVEKCQNPSKLPNDWLLLTEITMGPP